MLLVQHLVVLLQALAVQQMVLQLYQIISQNVDYVHHVQLLKLKI